MNPLLSALLRVVLFCAGTFVTYLPRKLELRLGRLLGKLFLTFDWKRRKVAYDNMRRCLPELGPAGWERLLAENYAHYGMLTLELLHMFSPFPRHYAAYVKRTARVKGFENWKKAEALGKGALYVTAHMANWELMVALGTLHGMPLLMVTRRLKPEWLHKKIEAQRQAVGAKLVYVPRTLPTVMKALRANEAVGFAMDQYAHPPFGIPVPFFGTKVDTLGAVGTLAQRTGATIAEVTQTRDARGIVHIEIGPPLDLGADLADPAETTAAINRIVENIIRRNPTQWLWVHRRFKNLPVGPNRP